MADTLLILVVALVAAAVVFGVAALATGRDPGLTPVEPDGRAIGLPASRPLAETDPAAVRFDVAFRGYRMDQVDRALKRLSYDIGYKDELVRVLESEVVALREGRSEDAEALRRAREVAAGVAAESTPEPSDEPAEEPAAEPAAAKPAAEPVVALEKPADE